MKTFSLIICLIAIAGAALAQSGKGSSSTAVPFTPEPRQLQWRIGFDLGNVTIVEAPELNPEDNSELAVQEAERVLPRPDLSFGLALLPFSQVAVRKQQLVNPRDWTILDLQGRTKRRTFQALGVFIGTRLTTTEGGYHLVSVEALPLDSFLGLRREPAPQDLVFGFAGRMKRKMEIRTKLSETKWDNLVPVEDAATLPAGYDTAKRLLDGGAVEDIPRFLYGASIQALMRNRIGKVWLLNYSHPDTTKGVHPWGIFAEEAGGLQPLYIHKPDKSEDQYVAYLTASIDLNEDGNDELVIEASYRIGTAYKVISLVGGKYQEVFTSYYRGPA
jgi:hypothetical protein